jgi:hypothetical protein
MTDMTMSHNLGLPSFTVQLNIFKTRDSSSQITCFKSSDIHTSDLPKVKLFLFNFFQNERQNGKRKNTK